VISLGKVSLQLLVIIIADMLLLLLMIVFGNLIMSQRTDGDRIVKARVYYNALDLHKQLSESFRPHVYRPVTLSNYKITGEPNSLIDVAQFIATMEEDETSNAISWRVHLQNYLVTGLLGNLTKKTLMLSDDENACRWIPESIYLPSSFSSSNSRPAPSPDRPLDSSSSSSSSSSANIYLRDENGNLSSLSPSTDVFIQLFPYLEASTEDENLTLPQEEIIPNRLFGIVHRCRPINDDYLILYLIFDFLQRLVEMFDRETAEGSTSYEHISRESHYAESSSTVSVHQTETSCSYMYMPSENTGSNSSSSEPKQTVQHHPRMTLSGIPSQSPLQHVFYKAMEVFDMIGHVLIGFEEESEGKANNLAEEDYVTTDEVSGSSGMFDGVDESRGNNSNQSRDVNQHAKQLSKKVNTCVRVFLLWINSIDRLQGNGVESGKSNLEMNSFSTADTSRNTALMSIRDGSVALTLIGRDQAAPLASAASASVSAPPVSSAMSTTTTHSAISSSTNLNLSPIEISVVSTISNELQQFFVQIRELKLIPRLLAILRIASSPEEVKNAEGFLFLCWTRHNNPSIQTLLAKAKTLMSKKLYDEALTVTSQVSRPLNLITIAYFLILHRYHC
jgi:hypothetical protein